MAISQDQSNRFRERRRNPLSKWAPFIAPVAALMAEILKAYKETKDTDEKRGAELARDLCGTILRIKATNHKLLARAAAFIKEYDKQGVVRHVTARNELGSEMSSLNRELDSFGTRFRSGNTRTLEKVHGIASVAFYVGLKLSVLTPTQPRRKARKMAGIPGHEEKTLFNAAASQGRHGILASGKREAHSLARESGILVDPGFLHVTL
ncbi:hypothetical protein DFH09DRAFT_1099512 [Mycena vulgaris]|nr:hypothetical protein DFH09DRAFT_1099512 [Mycena vulgaris]